MKPDTSFVLKSGHFHLLTTLTNGRSLARNEDAASAAFEVGYESPSQFNRKYRRFFGRPPIRDIKALRGGKVVAITIA
jgi:AraC-like DNA-binding protein